VRVPSASGGTLSRTHPTRRLQPPTAAAVVKFGDPEWRLAWRREPPHLWPDICCFVQDVADLSCVACRGRTRGATQASNRHPCRHERPATAELCRSLGGGGDCATVRANRLGLCLAARVPRVFNAEGSHRWGLPERGERLLIFPPFSRYSDDCTTLHDTVTGVRLHGPWFVPL